MWLQITEVAFLLIFYGFVILLKRREHATAVKFEILVEKLDTKVNGIDASIKKLEAHAARIENIDRDQCAGKVKELDETFPASNQTL